MSGDMFNKTVKDVKCCKNNIQIQKMNKDIKAICDSLIVSCDEFDDKNAIQIIELIEEYILEHERILYSFISNYIFSLSGKRGTFITNLDLVVEKTLSSSYKKQYNDKLSESNPLALEKSYKNDGLVKYLEKRKKEEHEEKYKKIKKTVLKIYDHSHLAIHQFENLKQNDDEFKRKFAENIAPVRIDVDKQVNEFTKSMNAQLISLVGIFTAMSFLVFGGISSLGDIFRSAKSIPILQVTIIGTVWGLCITNLIFVFMFFVSKMAKLNIKSCDSKNANLIKKYPLIFWSELIIITILAMSLWMHYIDIKNIGGWFVNIGTNHPRVVSIAGLVIILIAFIICAYILIKHCNEKDISNEHERQIRSENNVFNQKALEYETQSMQESAATKCNKK